MVDRIPETYVLSEEDIREAITLWLNQEHLQDEDYSYDFEITFDVQTKREVPKGAVMGGMTAPIEVKVITAKAVKDD